MSRLRDITVLITAAGNVYMPGTTECLKKNGERRIRLIGADMNDDPTILQMCDQYYSVPRGEDSRYAEVLLDICKKEKVDIVLPIMSVELETLSENKKRFEEIGTMVSVSESEPLEIANNKLKLLDYLRRKGLPCADYEPVYNLQELEEGAKRLGYGNKRVCVKATHGSGSRGFRILEKRISRYDRFIHEKPSSSMVSLHEMKDILSEAPVFPELILMEYLPGNEYTVDLVADRGKVEYVCCRKSLGMDNSIMLNSQVVDNRKAMDLCVAVTEQLGLEGNIGFDLREGENGIPLIMECNPRITAGIPVFAKAGVNLLYLNVKRMLGERLEKQVPKEGITVRKRWIEMA